MFQTGTIYGKTYVIEDDVVELFGGDEDLMRAYANYDAGRQVFRAMLFTRALKKYPDQDEGLIECIKSMGFYDEYQDFLDCLAGRKDED